MVAVRRKSAESREISIARDNGMCHAARGPGALSYIYTCMCMVVVCMYNIYLTLAIAKGKPSLLLLSSSETDGRERTLVIEAARWHVRRRVMYICVLAYVYACSMYHRGLKSENCVRDCYGNFWLGWESGDKEQVDTGCVDP